MTDSRSTVPANGPSRVGEAQQRPIPDDLLVAWRAAMVEIDRLAEMVNLNADDLIAAEDEVGRLLEALDRGRRFERAYQESLGATPTPAQWDRLDSLQSAFLDAYTKCLEGGDCS